jgi:hypothetical protein
MDVPISDNPSNSHKAKSQNKPKKVLASTGKPKKEVEKVVTGEVTKRKVPLGQRVKAMFFSGDFPGVTRYVTSEVLLPALRNLIVDSTTKGIERMIYGETQTRRYGPDPRTRYSYNNPVSRDTRRRSYLPDQPPHPPPRSKTHAIGEVILSSKEEGELVIERLTDIIDTYDVASVADLYDLLGLPTSYIDNKWGWTVLTYADVRQVREGFLIDLPPADPI